MAGDNEMSVQDPVSGEFVPLDSPEARAIVGDVIAAAVDQGDSPKADAGDSKKLAKRLRRIEKANKLVMELNSEVAERDSDVKAAKGRLAAAQEDRDSAVVELSRIIADIQAGQDILPNIEEDEPKPDSSSADNTPISELGSKQLRKLVGADMFDAAKDREEPIGLSASQLAKLESAEIHTVADLEKNMREVRDWWLIIAKSQDAQVVTRVSDSLAAYRSKCPIPERSSTVIERLAETNAAPPTILEANASA